MLEQTQLDEFKHKLLDRRVQIEKILLGTTNELDEMRNLEFNDDADYASVSADSMVDNAILIQQRKELAEIDLALDKIKKGIYGICEMCEEPIGILRLQVKNFARFCITCREINEKEANK